MQIYVTEVKPAKNSNFGFFLSGGMAKEIAITQFKYRRAAVGGVVCVVVYELLVRENISSTGRIV